MIWLKIACVVTFIAVMVALKFGLESFFDLAGPQFAWGFVSGGGLAAATFLLCSLSERRSNPEEH